MGFSGFQTPIEAFEGGQIDDPVLDNGKVVPKFMKNFHHRKFFQTILEFLTPKELHKLQIVDRYFYDKSVPLFLHKWSGHRTKIGQTRQKFDSLLTVYPPNSG